MQIESRSSDRYDSNGQRERERERRQAEGSAERKKGN